MDGRTDRQTADRIAISVSCVSVLTRNKNAKIQIFPINSRFLIIKVYISF